MHPARAAQGFEVELGSRGQGGSTDRDGMSKCCLGIRLAVHDESARIVDMSPGLPAIEQGWNCPASLAGPPAAAKIRRFPCDRAALPQQTQQVPGGYAALCLGLMGKLRARCVAGGKGVSREWAAGSRQQES